MLLVMNSLNPQTSRTTEDLDAVIGRFQAWTMTQPQTKPLVRDAVSEISYEQALRATARYRHAETPAQPTSQPSIQVTEQVPYEPVDTVELSNVGKATSVHKRQHGKPARKAVPAKKASAAATPSTTSNQTVKKTKHANESFAQVLRQETGLARVGSSSLRSSALTVRLSQDESALIKARADEAQLSTSAYLRQCALEVETLRVQVRETLAKYRTPGTVSADAIASPALPPVASPSRPGLFAGLRLWLARRLGGQQISTAC
jgi:Mobilization protein NikA